MGTKQYGKNKAKCDRYKGENRLERNKARIAKKIAHLLELHRQKVARRAGTEARA